MITIENKVHIGRLSYICFGRQEQLMLPRIIWAMYMLHNCGLKVKSEQIVVHCVELQPLLQPHTYKVRFGELMFL